LVGLAGPAAYSLDTAATAHSGAIPSAGPAVQGGGAGGGPPGGLRHRGGVGGQPGFGRFGGGNPFGQAPGGQGGRGGMGGLLDGGTPDAELVAVLQQDADRSTWVGAGSGSNPGGGVRRA